MYAENVALEMQKMGKKVLIQMKSYTFNGEEPLSIISY